jgi:hypothetical protein
MHGLHFSHAPIIEAIINIQVDLPETAHDRSKSLGELVTAEYPDRQDVFQMTA